MAIIDGVLAGYSEGGHSDISYWGAVLDGFDPATYQDYGIYDALSAESGTVSRVVQDQPSWVLSGIMGGSYYDDFYNRIHVAPSTLNMGNLLSEQVREFTIWNAYTTPQTLNGITATGTDGVELTEPAPAPITYSPMQERTYSVSVTLDGSPTIDASYEIKFAGEESLFVIVVGQRVVVFPFVPANPVKETLSWLTEIIKTRQGEQRIAMRHSPRQSWGYRYVLLEHDMARLKNMAGEWSHRQWGLPVWLDATENISVLSGATEIIFDTSGADYRDGGLAILFADDETFEAVEIVSVLADRITLAGAVSADYAAAMIAPVRFAWSMDGFNISRLGAGINEVNAEFLISDNINLAALYYEQYKGYDVVTDRSCISGGALSERIRRPMVEIDNGQGVVVTDTTHDYTDYAQTVETVVSGRDERWRLRQWLHSRYGKQKAFYLPSFNRDITPVAPSVSLNPTIQVKDTHLALYGEFPIPVMIIFQDGSHVFRDILSAELTSGVASITFDSDIGDHAVEDFDMITFLTLTRLNSDNVTINHEGSISKVSIPAMKVTA